MSDADKLTPSNRFVNLNVVANVISPYAIELTWTGPAAEYLVTSPLADVRVTISPPPAEPAAFDRRQSGAVASKNRAPVGAVAGGTTGERISAPQAPPPNTGRILFARPQYGVIPNATHTFKIVAPTLPDGRIICTTIAATTPPVSITPLFSQFVAPDDIRVGFAVPPYAEYINIYRVGYNVDGKQSPANRHVFQERLTVSDMPVSFELRRPISDTRKRINPGLPPLPTNYNQPVSYPLMVEAVWGAGLAITSKAQALIQVEGPLPLKGWADLHTHPMSHLAFAGKLFHGAPDVGSLLPALSLTPPTTALGVPVPFTPPWAPWGCLVEPGRRAQNIFQALGDDAATHGDPVQSACGDVVRKAIVILVESKYGLHQPGRISGAPTFNTWPTSNTVLHQKMWIDWIRRAHEGGLRAMVALSHNSRLLAELAKGQCKPGFPCLFPTDDAASSDLQIREIKALVARHPDFMEVALDSASFYRIVGANKMAVILGVEIDNIGNFKLQQPPTAAAIRAELLRLHNQGVRYIFPVHVTDNVFGGTAPYDELFNVANAFETGRFWQMECAAIPPFANDQVAFQAPNMTVISDLRKVLPPGMQSLIPNLPLPSSPQNCPRGPRHRNALGLNPFRVSSPDTGNGIGIGEFAIREMMRLGMIIDIDHMSHRTAEEVLSIAERVADGGYPVMSGHSGLRIDDPNSHLKAENSRTQLQLVRIGCLGGMFGLGTGHDNAVEWARNYQQALDVINANTTCQFKELGAGAVALGTDANSLVPTPRMTGRNIYGVTVNGAQRFPDFASTAGEATWQYNHHGVAHYGMFADFVKDVWTMPRNPSGGLFVSGQELVDNHLERNADNFWRMWVKVEKQKSNWQTR